VRLFIAIELPAELGSKLCETAGRLFPTGNHKVKVVERENLHLTLAFIGEVQPSLISAIILVMEQIAGEFPPVDAVVKGIGVFPAKGMPRVVWAGVWEKQGHLAAMHRVLVEKLSELQMPVDTKFRYRPHITLARIKEVGGGVELNLPIATKPVPFGGLPIRELVLMESRLSREGSKYYPVERIPLNGLA